MGNAHGPPPGGGQFLHVSSILRERQGKKPSTQLSPPIPSPTRSSLGLCLAQDSHVPAQIASGYGKACRSPSSFRSSPAAYCLGNSAPTFLFADGKLCVPDFLPSLYSIINIVRNIFNFFIILGVIMPKGKHLSDATKRNEKNE
jgi:hypothetical protein